MMLLVGADIQTYTWVWINTTYFQTWTSELPNKDYSAHFRDVGGRYRSLANTSICIFIHNCRYIPFYLIVTRRTVHLHLENHGWRLFCRVHFWSRCFHEGWDDLGRYLDWFLWIFTTRIHQGNNYSPHQHSGIAHGFGHDLRRTCLSL